MKKLLVAILAVLLLVSVTACGDNSDDETSGVKNYAETTTYDVKDTTGKVLGTLTYTAQGTDFAIITKYTPRISGAHSVYIPEVLPTSERTVIGIGSEAFKACSSVTSVTLPSTVETIGDWAFSDCTSLYQMEIPSSVKSIGKGAFESCPSLTELKFAENSSLTSIGDYAFYNCDVIETVTIPEGTESLGDAVFMNCPALKTVTLPETLTTIGKTAFAKCSAIEKITLGDNIESLGEYAFGTMLSDEDKAGVIVYKKDTTTDKTINSSNSDEE